jgi:hypothetical protein
MQRVAKSLQAANMKDGYAGIPRTNLFTNFANARNNNLHKVFTTIMFFSVQPPIAMPPPIPGYVTIGIPAWPKASISRPIVRRFTSNFSAKYGAVTRSFCIRTVSIPVGDQASYGFPPLFDTTLYLVHAAQANT